MWRTFFFIVVLCAVIGINCRKYNSDRNVEYLRNKRAKYYSPTPHKFYSRPSYSSHHRGPYQYSPSNGYSSNDIGPHVFKQRPYKVNKRPFNEGLGDEGIQSISQYLSNNDLDKIIELAIERERHGDKYITSDPLDNEEFNAMYFNNNENNIVLKNVDDESHKYLNGLSAHFDNTKYPNSEHQSSYTNYPSNYVQVQPTVDNVYSPIPIYAESIPNPVEDERFLSDAYFQNEFSAKSPDKNFFTDEITMQEERLPKPVNLREDDYDISFSNNAPAIAKPETSYQIENFASLPLMDFENSKLETVNSYSVPHYSVISPNSRLPPAPSFRPILPPSSPSTSSSISSSVLKLISAPIVEPAPPPSAGKEQSDAHLKATNIWTHRSKGTAYTLHDDGTLTLERAIKSKYQFP